MKPHFWNTSRNGNTYDVRGKWVNWLSDQGWRAINTAIQGDRTVTELPCDVEFPLSAQGICTVNANGRFSMPRHIDERNGDNPEPSLELTVQALTQTNVTGHADPDHPERWIYPEAWPGADLRYGLWHGRGVRIEKVVEIDPQRVQSGDLEYKFLMQSSQAKAFIGTRQGPRPWNGLVGDATEVRGQKIFMARGDSELRGITLKSAVAWYYAAGELVTESIKLRARITAPDTVEVTKVIPAALVLAAGQAGSKLWTDATFYPDADPETSTVDGVVYRYGVPGTWSDVRGGAGTGFSDSVIAPAVWPLEAAGTSSQWNDIERLAYLFDTTSLTGSVSTATLKVEANSVGTSQINAQYNVFTSNPTSNTALASADYAAAKWGETKLADTGVSMTSWRTVTLHTWTLNATGRSVVSVGGITKLGIRSENDGLNNEPTWPGANQKDSFEPIFSESSGTAQDPTLEVTTAAAVNHRTLLGVGT